MGRRKLVSILVVGALSILSVAGFVTYRTVYAQATTPTQAPSAPSGAEKGMRGGHMGGVSEQGLADALGIDLAKLQAAQQTATAEALKQAVSDGLITQKQADQFSSGSKFGFPGGMGWLTQNGIDYNALLAKALGITTDQLQAARQKAESAALDQAVKDGRMSQDQADLMKAREALYANPAFQASQKTAYEAGIAQAVKDGVITQAQADLLLKDLSNTGAGRGFPGFGGHGGRGFGPRGGDEFPAPATQNN